MAGSEGVHRPALVDSGTCPASEPRPAPVSDREEQQVLRSPRQPATTADTAAQDTAGTATAGDGGGTAGSLLGRLHRQAASYLTAAQEAPPSPSRVANLRGYLVGRWSTLPDTGEPFTFPNYHRAVRSGTRRARA